MKTCTLSRCGTALAGLVLSGLLPLPWASAGGEAARQEIARVLDRQAAAWNKGDLEGFMAGYWRSPDVTFFTGPYRERGWQAVLDRYRKRYQGEGKKMGKLTFHEVRIDLLGPDAALVRGRWHLELGKESRLGLFTLVFRKLPGGWRIVHDHTSS